MFKKGNMPWTSGKILVTVYPKEKIESLYLREEYNQREISELLKESIYTIRKNFEIHKIKPRQGHSDRTKQVLAEKSFKDAKMDVICKYCGKPFSGYANREKPPLFCSRECYKTYWRDLRSRTKTCELCGKEYIPYSIGLYDDSKYCSMECLWEALKTEPKSFVCENCGVTFFRNNTNHEYRFCSKHCSLSYKGRTGIEEKVYKVLVDNGFEFEEQKRIGGFWVDFLIQPNLVIECDGEYWHNKTEIVERDMRKNRYLTENGYKLFRITGKKINETNGEVVLEVLNIG